MVLDDLKAENYEMLSRHAGLNVAQGKLLLSKLAKFHAASAVRYQTVCTYFVMYNLRLQNTSSGTKCFFTYALHFTQQTSYSCGI